MGKDRHKRLMNLCEREGWTCYLCGKEIPRRYILQSPMAPSMEHVVPKWRLKMEGRKPFPGNIRLAHRHCNNHKDNRQPLSLEAAQRAFEKIHGSEKAMAKLVKRHRPKQAQTR